MSFMTNSQYISTPKIPKSKGNSTKEDGDMEKLKKWNVYVVIKPTELTKTVIFLTGNRYFEK